jgi:hypothetical protein
MRVFHVMLKGGSHWQPPHPALGQALLARVRRGMRLMLARAGAEAEFVNVCLVAHSALWAAGLSDDVSDDSVTEHFAKAGPVLKVRMQRCGHAPPIPVPVPIQCFLFFQVRRKTASPFLFLEFATKSEAWKALKLSGTELGSAKIAVKTPPGGLELLKSAQGLNLKDIRAQLAQKLAAESIASAGAAPAQEAPSTGPKSVVADNMPKGTNAEAIRVTFGDCGTITAVVIKRGGRRATISFDSHADAKKCAKRSGSLRIGDKRIRVILDSGGAEEEDADASCDVAAVTAPSAGTCIAQTVLVSGLHVDANEHDIRAVLQECGAIVAVRIQPRAKSRVAFVDFATKTAAKKATKLSGLLIRKQLVSIKPSRTTNKDRLLRAYADAFMAQPPVAADAPKVKAADTNSCHTVIVKNIDYNADEDSIKKYFSKCGQIKAVRTFKEKDTGAFKGLTYIEFSEGGKPATKAVSCNGELFFGRPLKVDYAASADDVLQARYEHFRNLKKGGNRGPGLKEKDSSKNGKNKKVGGNDFQNAGVKKGKK